MKEITYIIPYKKDSQDRENNLNAVIRWLQRKAGEPEIIIAECDKEENFSRTKIVNKHLEFVNTKYVCVNDCDIIMKQKAYFDSLLYLKSGSEFIYFFNSYTYNIEKKYALDHEFEIEKVIKTAPLFYATNPGGIFFADLEAYQRAGAENPNFTCWGGEDNERLDRMKILDVKMTMLNFSFWHFDHDRTTSYYNKQEYESNCNEWKKVAAMSKEQLQQYVKTWNI